jgi:hypothetical protein
MRGIAGGKIIAADILSAVGNFPSASAINVALGKLPIHQIMGRIARQDALAYIFQLILRTLPSVKAELKDNGYTKYGREETRRMLSGPSDLDEITDPAQLPTGAATLHAPHSARTPPETASPAPSIQQSPLRNGPVPPAVGSPASTPSAPQQPPGL